jgi:hypothetical protein
MNSEEEEPQFINDNKFDLYTHMKLNIKTSSPYCEIHESKYTHYCINCKRAVCEVCKDSFHNNHSIQVKKPINFDLKKVELIFGELESLIDNTRVFTEPETMKKELVEKVDEEYDALENALKELKRRKVEEIEVVFGDNGNAENLMQNIKTTKSKVTEFYNNYNSFFYSEDVKDEDNALFLSGYDVFNTGIGVSKEYITMINQIRAYYLSFEEGKHKKTDNINSAIQAAIEEEKKNEIMNTNLLVIDNTESAKDLENPTQDDEIKFKVVSSFEKLGEDLFKELKEKLDKTTEFIENFKKLTFESFKKNGSLIELEKIVKTYDEKTNKRTNFLKGKANLKFSPSQAKAYSITGALPSQAKIITQSQKLKIDNKDEVKQKEDEEEKRKKNDEMKRKEEEDENKKDTKLSKLYMREEKKEDSKLLKHIKGEEIPKVKLTHFGATNQKKNVKTLLESVYNPGMRNKEDLQCLEENTEEDIEAVSRIREEDESSEEENEEESNLFDDDEDEVKLENGFNDKPKDAKTLKLENMFKPIMKPEKKIDKPKSKIIVLTDDEKKYKVNNKLQEMIKENQRLCSLIKTSEDINLVGSVIRRYFSYQILEFIRKNFYKVNKGYSSNVLFGTEYTEEKYNNENVKIFEGTNEVQIYDRPNMRLIKRAIPFVKKLHGTTVFLAGCRTYYMQDKLFINGGKDKNGDTNVFLCYNVKDNKLTKLPPMNKPRSYHTLSFHENLKSLVAVGGENNKYSEMFDFFLNTWNELPELNCARANISLHIDKVGTFAYAVGGVVGDIAIGKNSDVIELLDLVDINQGWAKVDYRNKANVDLKFSHNGVYPLTSDKLLIYGGQENRGNKKCYVIFDLTSFDIKSISMDTLEQLKIQTARSPDFNGIFD